MMRNPQGLAKVDLQEMAIRIREQMEANREQQAEMATALGMVEGAIELVSRAASLMDAIKNQA